MSTVNVSDVARIQPSFFLQKKKKNIRNQSEYTQLETGAQQAQTFAAIATVQFHLCNQQKPRSQPSQPIKAIPSQPHRRCTDNQLTLVIGCQIISVFYYLKETTCTNRKESTELKQKT
jgi:hypothetical protein